MPNRASFAICLTGRFTRRVAALILLYASCTRGAGGGATMGAGGATSSGPSIDPNAASGGARGSAAGGMIGASGEGETGAPAGRGSGGATGNGGDSATPTGGSGGAPASADAAAPVPVAGISITVKAGIHDRAATPVSFSLMGKANAAVAQLRPSAGGGAPLPLQIDDDGKATFILPMLAAGAEATFIVDAAAGAADAVVKATKGTDAVDVSLGGAPVMRYQMQGKLPPGIGDAYLRGGYLHPIQTPMGATITDDYPGDHRHHHGLWSAWAKSSFEGHDVDFWNMGERTAKVDFAGLDRTWDGPVHGGFRSRQAHIVLSGGAKTALNESWDVTVYRTQAEAPPYYLFDLDSVQEAASMSPVMLHQYIYGGFALRGAASWGGAAGATFLTSEGKTRANGDGTNARWCYIGGKVMSKGGAGLGGYAALMHPSNFRAPQPVRINPTDPFFSIAPVRDSGFDITPGKPYVSRFRIVVLDGPPDAALLERLWNDYADPPAVSVSAP